MIRNTTLDWFKIALSILVICIHLPPLFKEGSTLSWYFGNSGLTTIAVPIFFIINGYYFLSITSKSSSARKYFFKILMMHILWSFIYLPLYYEAAPLKYIIILFTTGYFHLWYLPALLVSSICFFLLIQQIKSTTTILTIAFLLYFFIQVTMGFDTNIKAIEYTRHQLSNILTGLLFISIGAYIKDKFNIKELNKNIILYTVIGIATIFIILIHPHFTFPYKQIIIKSFILPFTCISIFTYILKISRHSEAKGYKKYLSNISAGIYFTHLYITIRFYPFIQTEYNIINLAPIVLICIFLSILLIIINKKVKYLL